MKYLNLLLIILISLFAFSACDDAQMMIDPIINTPEISEPPPQTQPIGQFNGVLHRVSDIERFGSNATKPVALEWNGTNLYMIAQQGNPQYLFIVDKDTGTAKIVNRGAQDFGGKFTQGRNFTQVYYTSPRDLAWDPKSQTMYAPCGVLDSIVGIDLESGLALRINWNDDFCLTDEDGYGILGAPTALTCVGDTFYMSAVSTYRISENKPQLSRLHTLSQGLRCATRVGNIEQFDVGESNPKSLCWDGNSLYMSGKHNRSLYIVDTQTSQTKIVYQWEFAQLPTGHIIKPSITGITIISDDMYAVEEFTNALYKVGKVGY